MAETYKMLTIDVNEPIPEIVIAVQEDINSRYLDVTLTDEGVPIDLTAKRVHFSSARADEVSFYKTGVITNAKKGRCQFELTRGELKAANTLYGQIEIWTSDNEKVLTTHIITIDVVESLRVQGNIESSNEYGALVVLYQNMYEIKYDLTQAQKTITETLDTLRQIYEGQDQLYTDMQNLYSKQNTLYTGQQNLYTKQNTLYDNQRTLYTQQSDLYTKQQEALLQMGNTNDTGGTTTSGTLNAKANRLLDLVSEVKNQTIENEALWNQKLDKTEFNGDNIADLLEQIGWQGGGGDTTEIKNAIEEHNRSQTAHTNLFSSKADKNLSNVTKEDFDNKVTTRTSNTALGVDTLKSSTGGINTAVGYHALLSNTTGGSSTAVGAYALENNTTGGNTAVGAQALSKNTTGGSNTAVGYHALLSNTTGGSSTAVGYGALRYNTTGNSNVATGKNALENNTTGKCNVATGLAALQNNTTGEYNTAIGYMALYNNTAYSYCTGLGYNAQVTGDHQVQLGGTGETVYATKAVVTRSDERDKIDITDSDLGLNFILKLKPRRYKMNPREAYFQTTENTEMIAENIATIDYTAPNDGSKARKRPHYGLVAQEVKQVMNELDIDFAGYLDSKVDGGEDVLSLGYTEFIAPMIKAIQQQQEMIEALKKEILYLKGDAI